MRTKRQSPSTLVKSILEGYSQKGVFRSLHAEPPNGGVATFRMMWHHDRRFEMIFDEAASTFSFPGLLPGIPAKSAMYAEVKAFLAAHQSPDVLEHRRLDPVRVKLRCSNRGGSVTVSLVSKDRDLDYATRKFIHTVHEIFLVFLMDGPYFDYLVENFGLDPDKY